MKYFILTILSIMFISVLAGCTKGDDDSVITSPVNHTLIYNTNGSTSGSAPASLTHQAGSVITLDPGTGFSRNGYTFAGWNTTAQSTGDNYDGGSSYTLTSSTTLYARWNAASSAVAKRISVEANGNMVIFELNSSSAAQSLYNQLPLTLPVQNFGSNEKIFYPPQRLDLSNTPVASGTSGGLAYYEPWGDVIMFYGNYGAMPTLGRAVQGVEHISNMSGSIQIKKVN